MVCNELASLNLLEGLAPRKKRGKQLRRRTGRVTRPSIRQVESSTLILECDHPKLSAQGNTLANALDSILAFVAPFPRHVIRTTCEDQLLDQFREASKREYSSIVVVGHSNRNGIQFANGCFKRWDAFGEWITPFQPRHLFLAACEGGQWLPSQALFETVPSLETIYGSPTPTNAREVALYAAIVPLALYGIRVPQEAWVGLQVANLFSTGGIIYRQTRRAFKNAKPIDVIQEELLEALAPVVRNVVKQLIGWR